MPHAVKNNALLVRSQVFSTSGVGYDKLVMLPRDFYFVVGLGAAPIGALFLAHHPEEHWVSARPDGRLLASLTSASAASATAAPAQNLEQWLPNHSFQVRALHYTLHPTLARRGLRRSCTIISCAPYSDLIPVLPLAQAAPLAAALEIGSRAGAAADAQVRDAPLEPAALRAAACEERARLSLACHLGC